MAAQQTGGIQGIQPALQAIIQGSSPTFARPGWEYLHRMQAPQAGPLPRLAQGSGVTGTPEDRRNGFVPGGYLAQQDYKPTPMDYNPPTNPRFLQRIPQSIHVGDDGLHALNPTYRAHDSFIAQYMPESNRSAFNWQVMSFAANWRNLLGRQQVARYNIYNQIALARPLQSSDYFLGYRIDSTQASPLGSSGMGYPLGSGL